MHINRSVLVLFSISFFEKKLFAYALILNIILTLSIKFFPLKSYYSILNLQPKRIIKNKSRKLEIIAAIKKTINRINKLPLVTPNCLVRSIIAKILSAKYGINSSIKLNLTKRTTRLYAHALIDYDSDTNNLQLKLFNSYGN